MASPLKQIHKSSFIKYLVLALSGALSVIAFSPFDIKVIILLSLAILIYSIANSINYIEAFKRSLAWGLGYWIAGTGWLIVSIHFYGNTNLIISILIILLMGIMLALVFITPISLIKLLKPSKNIFIISNIYFSLKIKIKFWKFNKWRVRIKLIN